MRAFRRAPWTTACAKPASPLSELDLVGFYEKPLVKFDAAARDLHRMRAARLEVVPDGDAAVAEREALDGATTSASRSKATRVEVLFGEHHESHAASAFYPSPFEQAAIVTMDGVGEWATSSIGVGRGHEIEILRELRFPHSLGLLYSAFTYFTGFRVNSGEYKVMGLAPYGEPKYVKTIKDHLVEIRDDGSLWMNMEYFTYPHGLTMTGDGVRNAVRRPGAAAGEQADPARNGSGAIDSGHHRRGDAEDGGVSLIAKPACAICASPAASRSTASATAGILREGPFDQIWIQPAAGDAGGALGVALGLWHRHLDKPRVSAGAVRDVGAAVSGRRGVGRMPAICRWHERLVSRAALQRRRDRRVSSLRTATWRAGRRTAELAERSCRAAGGRESRRPVSGPDGVRPARAGRAIHHRRRAIAEDAVGDEPEDQVS